MPHMLKHFYLFSFTTLLLSLSYVHVTDAANVTLSSVAAGARFGESLSICGNSLLISDPDSLGVVVYSGLSSGVVEVSSRTPAICSPDEVTSGDGFGASMDCLSNEIYAIGSPSSNQTGLVFIWNDSPLTNEPDEALVAPDSTSSDTWRFGAAVAVSNAPTDGAMDTVVVVGAPDRSLFTGAVFVYHLPNASSTDAQMLIPDDADNLDFFGSSLDISGSTIAASSPAKADTGVGAVYLFAFNATSQGWDQTHRLSPPDGVSGDEFGSNLAFKDENTLLIASTGKSSSRGAVYEYVLDGPGNWTYSATYAPSDLTNGAAFGSAIAISDDGNVLVGAPYQVSNSLVDAGAVYEIPLGDVTESWSPSTSNEYGVSLAMGSEGIFAIGSTNDGVYLYSPRLCGDGQTEDPEECDDGDTVSGDGCNSLCQIEFCGDGVVNNAGTESCDHGGTPSGICSRDCVSIEPSGPNASSGIFWGITVGLLVVAAAGVGMGIGASGDSNNNDDDDRVEDVAELEFDEIGPAPTLPAPVAISMSMPNFETQGV